MTCHLCGYPSQQHECADCTARRQAERALIHLFDTAHADGHGWITRALERTR